MKSIKWRVILYIFTFIAAASLTYMLVVYKAPVKAKGASQMGSANLPVVCVESDNGREYNYMHGYTCDAEQALMHDMITPVSSDRILKINILPYESNVSGIAYEVRNLEGTETIESEDVSDYTGEDGIVKAELMFGDEIEEGTEYMLRVIVSTEQAENACYFTRLVVMDGADVDRKLDYVDNFSQYTLYDDGLNMIKNKLETSAKGDNTNLGRVNIYCKLSQVGYAGLAPEAVSDRYITLNEINGTRASLTIKYAARTSDDTGTFDYEIKEYFRINQPDQSVTYVFNYDRWMEQIFDAENAVSADGEIYLGICSDDDINMKASEGGKCTCFVRNDELWLYRSSQNDFIKIFSFRNDNSYDDIRENYSEHDIKILSVDDEGNARFIVYGYMNRGIHEGKLGISVFSYSSSDNKSSEIVFIPRTDDYMSVAEDMNTVSYINDSDILYMYNNKSIYYVDCDTKESMVVANNVAETSAMMSEDTKLLIYQTDDGNGRYDSLHVLHLDTGVIYDIKAATGTGIKALGYIDGNIVYGEAYEDMISVGDNGNDFFPMYKITIMNPEHNVIGDYKQDNVYVTDVQISDGKIRLSRVSYDENGYLQTISDDQLLSNAEVHEEKLRLTERATDFRQKEKYISLAQAADNQDCKVRDSRYIYQDGTVINIVNSAEKKYDFYYAFGYGEVYRICDRLTDAIAAAARSGGVTVDSKGRSVWDRYKSKEKTINMPESAFYQTDDSRAAATDAILLAAGALSGSASSYEKGDNTAHILERELGRVYDLKYCDIDSALYYVDKGYPLMARTGYDEYQIVYGYNSNSVFTFDYTSGELMTYSKNDFDCLVSAYGTEIITASR